MEVKICRYHESRFWSVWVDGELLAVVVYQKGARAIREKILTMEGRLQQDTQA